MPTTPETRPDRGDGIDESPVDLGWDEVSVELTSRWPRLNEHDIEALRSEFAAFTAGNYQLLIGRLRERYGLDQSAAEEDVRLFVRALEPSVRGSPLRQHSSPTMGYGRPLGGR